MLFEVDFMSCDMDFGATLNASDLFPWAQVGRGRRPSVHKALKLPAMRRPTLPVAVSSQVAGVRAPGCRAALGARFLGLKALDPG